MHLITALYIQYCVSIVRDQLSVPSVRKLAYATLTYFHCSELQDILLHMCGRLQ